MNLVDMLKDQLAGDVGKKLGGMIGAKDSDMEKILGAGIPSVLSGLGAMASSKSGADNLAKTIEGLDSGSFGDLGKMLGSSAMSNGGSLLSGLMGNSVVDGIANTIAKFTGINVTVVKTALGLLTPLVLGSIGSSFKGAKPDGAGIAKLFSDQKSSIASAMPGGLSLGAVPGFQALASSVASSASNAATESSSGLGKLLVPGAVLAALIAAGVFIMNNGDKPADTVKGKPAVASNSKADDLKEKTANIMDQVKDSIPSISSIPDVDGVKTSVMDIMDGLFTKLESIQDAAGAEAALPALKELGTKIDGIGRGLKALPNDPRTMIGGLISAQLEKLNPLIEKISTMPGIGDTIKQVLVQLKEKLASYVS